MSTLTLNGVLMYCGNSTWVGARHVSSQFIGTGILHVLGPPTLGTVIMVH